MTIRITVQGSVATTEVAKFKKLVMQATADVRDKEQGRTLTYDFFAGDSGNAGFLIHEAYEDADALALHLQNLGARLAALSEVFIVERLIISGKLPEALVAQFKAMGGPATCYYGETISVL